MTADLIWRLIGLAAAFAGGAYLTWQWRADQRTALAAELDACKDHAAERGIRLAQMRRQRDEARARGDAQEARADEQEARAWEAEAAAHHLAERNAELARHERDTHDQLLPVLGIGDDSRLPAPLNTALDLRPGAPAVSMFMSNEKWRRLVESEPDAPLPVESADDGDGGGEVCGWLGEWPVLPARTKEMARAEA